MQSDRLTGATEDNVLTALCWSESHAAAIAVKVPPELFSTRAYVRIAEAAHTFLQRFNEPPRGHIRDLLEDRLMKGEEGKLLRRTLDAMEVLQAELKPEYVVEQLDRFIALRELSQAVEGAADALAKGDLQAAQDALYVPAANRSTSSGTWLHDPKRALRYLDAKEDDLFSSGIDVLDSNGVRPARKRMMLLIAPPKRGKSWWLVNVGKANLMRRKRVLHITLEMPEEEVAMRYVMAMFALSEGKASTLRVPAFRSDGNGGYSSIDFDTISAEELSAKTRPIIAKRLRALKSRARLLIKEFPTASLTIPQLNAYLDALKSTENFVPDLVIVDYPDLMAIDSTALRTDTGRLFKELRGLAMMRNIALVGATQGNRDSESAKTLKLKNVAEDWSKIMTADYILTYSRTEQERKIGLARIGVEAARGARDGWSALVTQSYEIGQFALDSVYMNNTMFAELKKATGADDGDKS